jgi:hypothetical protein
LTYSQFVVPARRTSRRRPAAAGDFQGHEYKAYFLAPFAGKVGKSLVASGFRRFRGRILTKLSTGFVDKKIAFVLPEISRLIAGRF